jgi:small GTP-binding protein
MLPILVIVGRPNVGKSTLFNRLTKSRAALVADFPGLTRDRHCGRGRSGERRFIVVDTGGFEPVAKTGILHEMAKQTRAAIAEADAVMFVVDGRVGLTAEDRAIGRFLRRTGRPVFLVVNKVEGMPAGRHGRVSRVGARRAVWSPSGARRERRRGDRACTRQYLNPRRMMKRRQARTSPSRSR